MPSVCDYPLCCRDNGEQPTITKDTPLAGKWGDYYCDLPEYTLQHMFDFIASN